MVRVWGWGSVLLGRQMRSCLLKLMARKDHWLRMKKHSRARKQKHENKVSGGSQFYAFSESIKYFLEITWFFKYRDGKQNLQSYCCSTETGLRHFPSVAVWLLPIYVCIWSHICQYSWLWDLFLTISFLMFHAEIPMWTLRHEWGPTVPKSDDTSMAGAWEAQGHI